MSENKGAGAPSDDAKKRFRQALERKNAASRRGTQEGTAGDGPVRGSETTGPVQRQFRRKSGSA